MGEQEGMFVEDRIKTLTAKIELKHREVKGALGDVSDFGKFFKLFSDYTGALDGAQCAKADSLLLKNIQFALTESADLTEKLKSIESRLTECEEMAKDIERMKGDI